jgi:hypothetical protein
MKTATERRQEAKMDMKYLEFLAVNCRLLTASECRDTIRWLLTDEAQAIGNTIYTISRKQSIRNVPPHIRRQAVQLMREAGTYNDGR